VPLTPGDSPQPRDPWGPLIAFQFWVIGAIAVAVIPSVLVAVAAVALNGGHALGGWLAAAVDVVLGVSLVTGLGVLAVGFKRFWNAQADARRRSAERKGAVRRPLD
jgi:hypothetical protein